MTDLVVAKFGGTSVADFDAMNRSIDVALPIPVLLCSPPLPA